MNLSMDPRWKPLQEQWLAGFGPFAVLLLLLGCQQQSRDDKSPSPPSRDVHGKVAGANDARSATQSDSVVSESPPPSKAPVSSEPTYEARFQQAIEKLNRGEVDDAWGLIKQLTIVKPKDSELMFLASRVMAARNDLSGAVKLISQIPAGTPQSAPAAGQAAEWMVMQGDLEGAEAKLVGLLKEYPNAVPGLRLLARIYNAQSRRWEASRPLERLIRLGDFTLAELLATVDYREYYSDETAYAAFSSAHPENPYVHFSNIRSQRVKNSYVKYIDALQSMVHDYPNMIEPWVWSATSLFELERFEELALWFENSPPGADKHPEYWYALGGLMLRTEKYEAAARCFAECIQLDRRHMAGYRGLADALLEMQRIDDAKRVRKFANDLTLVNDYAQQISYKYGEPKLYDVISQMYEAMGDDVAAFGWKAAGVTQGHLRMSEELKAQHAALRKGHSRPPSVLEGLSIDAWPIPELPSRTFLRPAPEAIADVSPSEIRLIDVAKKLGGLATFHNGSKPNRGWYTIEGVGGGVNVLDFDRDGWPDLAFSEAGDSPIADTPRYLPKTLYRSLAAKEFREVASTAGFSDIGYGQGIGVSDIDQDGFPDLLVANLGESRIYHNNGDGTFEYRVVPQSDPMSVWNSSFHAADLNGDSLPDLLASSYLHGTEAISRWCEIKNSERGACNPKMFPPGKNRILFSSGDWQWTVADPDLLDPIQIGHTLGTLVTDIDGRGGNDVFFANDVSPNALLLSQLDSDGTHSLAECAAAAGVAVDSIGRAQASMGIACGDQNRDGRLDIIVTNFYNEASTLYLQSLPGVFVDGTRRSKLRSLTVDQLGFGCQLTDLDSDGWLDFITVNGHIDDLTKENIPWQMPPQVLRNEKGQFRWLKDPSPGPYFDGLYIGRGLQMLDYNKDGKPDLIATHINQPAALLENTTQNKNHFLHLELVGTESEREAIGAWIRVECGDEFWVATMSDGDGYFGSNERLVQLGIGPQTRIDRVRVTWPSGHTEEWTDLEVDRRYRLIEKIGISSVGIN